MSSAPAPLSGSAARSPEIEAARQHIERALALARPPYLFEGEVKAADDLQARAAALEEAAERLDKALAILLLGGTGVGKSSLLNALAGDAVAKAGPVRPCTTAATFYAARPDDIGELKSIVEAGDFQVARGSAALEGKVVIDPPDFDSTNADNRAKLLRLLDAADLVIVVANRVKYRQAELFDLLRRFRQAKSFAFALNGRDDPLFTDAVTNDFREALEQSGFKEPKLFAVSALKAYEAKLGGLTPDEEAGDFAALEAMIGGELESRRVAEIKRANIDGALLDLLDLLLKLAPPAEDLSAERWEEELKEIRERLAKALARQTRIALFDSAPELERLLRDRQFNRFEGTFGIFASVWSRFLLYAVLPWTMRLVAVAAAKKKDNQDSEDDEDEMLAKARAAGPAPGVAAAQDIARRQMEAIPRASWNKCFDQARRDASRLGERLGLRDGLVQEALTGRDTADVPERALENASVALEDAIERQMTQDDAIKQRSPLQIAFSPLNLAPNFFLALASFHFAWGFIRGYPRFSILAAGFGLAVAVCAIQYAIVSRMIDAKGDAARKELLETAEGTLAKDAGDSLAKPLGDLAERARERLRSIRGLRDEVANPPATDAAKPAE